MDCKQHASTDQVTSDSCLSAPIITRTLYHHFALSLPRVTSLNKFAARLTAHRVSAPAYTSISRDFKLIVACQLSVGFIITPQTQCYMWQSIQHDKTQLWLGHSVCLHSSPSIMAATPSDQDMPALHPFPLLYGQWYTFGFLRYSILVVTATGFITNSK